MNDSLQEERYAQYLDYLCTTAHIKYGDCPEIDTLVQESIVAFFVREQKGEPIAHPKAMLEGILRHKYNDWLRRKYRNRLVSFETDLPGDIPNEEDDTSNDTSALSEEYTNVRREIGRLMRIYREVTVRHYVHGQSVDKIAAALWEANEAVKTAMDARNAERGERAEGRADGSVPELRKTVSDLLCRCAKRVTALYMITPSEEAAKAIKAAVGVVEQYKRIAAQPAKHKKEDPEPAPEPAPEA